MNEIVKQIAGMMEGTTTEPSAPDMVNHPPHYTSGGIECIDAIRAATKGLTGFVGYCVGNIIKYLWRFSRKNGVEDLEKAKWYLDRLIADRREG